MAKAYWVSGYRSIRDEDALAAYVELAGPAIEAAGALSALSIGADRDLRIIEGAE